MNFLSILRHKSLKFNLCDCERSMPSSPNWQTNLFKTLFNPRLSSFLWVYFSTIEVQFLFWKMGIEYFSSGNELGICQFHLFWIEITPPQKEKKGWSKMSQPKVILATASYDHIIRFWEAQTGKCYRNVQYPDSVCPF